MGNFLSEVLNLSIHKSKQIFFLLVLVCTCVCAGVELRRRPLCVGEAAPLLAGAGLAGVGGVVVGQGAGGRADAKVRALVRGGHRGVR